MILLGDGDPSSPVPYASGLDCEYVLTPLDALSPCSGVSGCGASPVKFPYVSLVFDRLDLSLGDSVSGSAPCSVRVRVG